MYCTICDNHLSKCTCPDLKERLEKLSKIPQLKISSQNQAAYEKQVQKNLDEKQLSE